MTAIPELLFGISLFWLFYAYFGYPLALWLLARRAAPLEPDDEDFQPTVTILTAAFNEVEVIGENLANKLELDYPAEKLDIVVISDESQDGTDEIVQGFADANPGRIRLIRQSPRQGKTSGLNLAMLEVRGEIVVFADANSLYEKEAVRRLVANFADPEVGYVTGKMIYTNSDGSVTGDGCTTYMRYENLLRAWETRVGSVVGVDGGIDAVRKALYQPMRADQLPDFVLPLNVVDQGYRVVYEPRAILKEPALSSSEQEYRMRVRVTLRALWALLDMRQLFNPSKFPLFSWQLTSHKLLRYMAFVPQVVLFITNAMLWEREVYAGLFVAQVVFYLLALAGYVTSARGVSFAPAMIAYYFTLLNMACMHAFGKFIQGKKMVLWKPRTG